MQETHITTIAQIIADQRRYFNSYATRSIEFRKQQLKTLKKAIQEHEQELYDAIYKDFKKSEFDTHSAELALIYSDIDEAIKRLRKWASRKHVPTNFVNFPAQSYLVPEPLGVSLVIGAWNYPYMLSLAPAVSAIAAGNTVVLKPSELPENTSKIMADIIAKYFDPGFFTVVEGGIPETTALLEQKFDKIFFTGSVPVGKIVYQAAAKHLTPVTLELGGKSPAFVTEDCNMKMSVKRLIWGKYMNAGQTCIAPDYIMVHSSVKEQFLKAAKAEIERSHYSVDHQNYVQIINERNTQRLVNMIDPQKLYHGGEYNIEERYIAPTILSDVTWEDDIMQEEIFGPIMPVLTYDDMDEAIEQIKAFPKPLSAYVFTKDKKKRETVLDKLSFGGGCVNDAMMHISNSHLPFGGVGDSGIGAYHSEEGFKAFSHYKSILDKPTWLELPLKYYPRTAFKLSWIKRIMRL